MSVVVNVGIDIKATTKALNAIQRKVIPKSASAAINKTAKSARGSGIKAISTKTKVKPGIVKKTVAISIKAKPANPVSVISFAIKTFNLIEFVPKSKRNAQAFRVRNKKGGFKSPGVKANAWGNSKFYKGSFIGRGKTSGKLLVLSRTSKARLPVKAIYGPSISKKLIMKVVVPAVQAKVRERFKVEFASVLRFNLSKIK